MLHKIILFIMTLSVTAAFAQNDRDYIRRGNRLMRDTLFSKAQVEYQKAIQFDNTNAQAHFNLGNALLFQNKPEDAMKEYETATRFEKNKLRLAKMYHNMGVLLQSAKQFDKAVACYRNSLRNNPASNETRYNYALSLYQLKKNGGGGENNQDQQEDKNSQDQQKDQQKQEQQKQDKQNDQKQDKKDQPNPEKMSKENAEQLLKAAMQDEKSTQEKIQQAQQKPQQKHLQKQW